MADKRMKVFAAVAELGSFTEAASHLYLTQPAVTFQIKQLEMEIGAALFAKTSHGASSGANLTPVGKIVLKCANSIQDAYAKMHEELQPLITQAEVQFFKPKTAVEADKFRSKFCSECKNRPKTFGVNCGLWVKAEQAAFASEEHPIAWQYLDGVPVCTEFQRQ